MYSKHANVHAWMSVHTVWEKDLLCMCCTNSRSLCVHMCVTISGKRKGSVSEGSGLTAGYNRDTLNSRHIRPTGDGQYTCKRGRQRQQMMEEKDRKSERKWQRSWVTADALHQCHQQFCTQCVQNCWYNVCRTVTLCSHTVHFLHILHLS